MLLRNLALRAHGARVPLYSMSKSRDNSSGFSLTTFPWLAATELRYTQVTVSNGALLPAAPVTTPVTVCVLRLWVWDCVAVMSARRSAVLLTHLQCKLLQQHTHCSGSSGLVPSLARRSSPRYQPNLSSAPWIALPVFPGFTALEGTATYTR